MGFTRPIGTHQQPTQSFGSYVDFIDVFEKRKTRAINVAIDDDDVRI